MALAKYGGGIIQLSGSVAGNTYARNRFGNYVRARTVPVNPQSARQSAARARIAFLAEEWGDTLTAAERGAWDTYAAAISWLNRLGETVKLTGFNHFIRANSAKLQIGSAVIAAGPTTLLLPNADPIASFALSVATGLTITFDDTLDWADEDDGAMIIEIGQPQNPTRNFFGGPWRFDQFIAGSVATPPTTPDGPNAVTSWTLIETQLAWVRARILRDDGRLSNFFGSGPVTIAA